MSRRMSLNTANTPDGAGVLIFNGEIIHIFIPAVDFTFEKSNNQGLTGTLGGQLFLTSHRIIFRAMPAKNGVNSFEMPFHSMQDVKLEQPIFGSNYIHGMASAMPGSNISGEVPWRINFKKGGCVEFGLALLKVVDIASRSRRPASAPPQYAPPAGSFFSAPPDYYAPSVPTAPSVLADRPPTEDIFMHEAPPPYSGVGEERAPLPTEELHRAGESAPPPPYSSLSSDSTALRQRRQ